MPVPLEPPPAAVIDTNAVFDWLIFADGGCRALASSIESGRLRWLASRPMRDECFHVLGRGTFASRRPDLRLLESAWDAHCTLVEPVLLAGAAGRVHCSDPDDQKFIDLALGHGARWLISKDRAVLRLAARLRRFGVEAVTPAAWAAKNVGTPPNGGSSGSRFDTFF